MTLAFVTILVYIINVPFGYWRRGEKRFSVNWFLAIHIPVIISVLLRYIFHIEFRWEYLLLFVFTFIAGQFTGKMIYVKKNITKLDKSE
ncbi:MAG: hypothetical protein C0597_14725 [Marinilabiliales bacterium]|nr:MAG: hypothetical protein C0597_14725 [Marinilabiliales bacterium]